MFAKIFESIYDGTLADNWQALVTFQQFLILADQQGVVDMTPAAIHRRTGIPLEIIQAGIEALEQPDPQSRTQDMDGRRIVRLDAGRGWGWFIVNHAAYRAKITAEEKREADRVRIAEKRAAQRSQDAGKDRQPSQPVAECREVSQGVAEVAHTEAGRDTEAGKELQDPPRSEQTHSQSTSRAGATDPPDAREKADSGSGETGDPPAPTPAGRACLLMRKRGCPQTNPSHPGLLTALAEGVTPETLADTVAEGIEAGKAKPFAWAIATARSRHTAGTGPPAPPTARTTAPRSQRAAADHALESLLDETTPANVVPRSDRQRPAPAEPARV